MPANLSPVYLAAEARFRSATDSVEKIAALEEMLRLVPKHKGTDKLQGDIKARLAKLRKLPKKKGSKGFSRHIPRQGAGQVALVGPPNAGKSALVGFLTHADPKVASYPFTTTEPSPGMMPFENIAFQLIDLPPLSDEHVESWVYDLVRASDLIWLVMGSADSLEGFDLCRRLLSEKHLEVIAAGTPLPGEIPLGWAYKPALLVLTGADLPESADNVATFRELDEAHWPVILVSGLDGQGSDALKLATLEAMHIIRVYTKQPGKPADRDQPFTLPQGSTLSDLARLIHKDIAASMKFARIWGGSVFDGQTVQGEHVLEEGDIVEIHA